MAAPTGSGHLGLSHGTALYVGSLVGPGVLLVPALAVQAAGAASLLAWVGLLVLSAPLAVTFAALGVRMPVSGGVAEYVRAGFGARAGLVTGGWFLTAVIVGAPAVSLIGGFYVAALTGSGIGVAAAVGLAILGTVLVANVLGLRISSRLQLVTASVLTLLIAIAVAFALPSRGGDNWHPFAPHGWWAIGTAANILVWLFVGWEAVAQLAGDFRDPQRQLPRAMALAFGVVTRALRRARRRHDRRRLGHRLARAARRPDVGRLRRDGPARDDRARRRADDGDDERLHRRRIQAGGGARPAGRRCRAGSRATPSAASRGARSRDRHRRRARCSSRCCSASRAAAA